MLSELELLIQKYQNIEYVATKLRTKTVVQVNTEQVEKLKELRLDVPQVTLLAYELKKNGINIPDGILTIDELTEALKRYAGHI